MFLPAALQFHCSSVTDEITSRAERYLIISNSFSLLPLQPQVFLRPPIFLSIFQHQLIVDSEQGWNFKRNIQRWLEKRSKRLTENK